MKKEQLGMKVEGEQLEVYDPYDLFEILEGNITLKDKPSKLEKICKEKQITDILKVNKNLDLNILIRFFPKTDKKSYSITSHYNLKNSIKKPFFNFYPIVCKIFTKYLNEVGVNANFGPIEIRDNTLLTEDQRLIKLDEGLSFLYLDEQQLLQLNNNPILNILKIMYLSPIYKKISPKLLSYELNKNFEFIPAIKRLSMCIRDENTLKKEYEVTKKFNKIISSKCQENILKDIDRGLSKNRMNDIFDLYW